MEVLARFPTLNIGKEKVADLQSYQKLQHLMQASNYTAVHFKTQVGL